jgi:hypothetical protein
MAKILVGLYDTLTDVEHVVHALGTEGFPHSAIRVATRNAAAHRGMDIAVGEWIPADHSPDVVQTLTDLGVPADEAHAYAEGLRRGGALVIVESSEEWASRGLALMNQGHAVDIAERTAQWRQEGGTGAAAHARSASAAPAAPVHPETATMPVVEEARSSRKREGPHGRVRVHSRVVERPV